MARARRLRAASRALEALVWLIVAGSVAAIGSVHPWAYVPLWGACLVAGLLLALRTRAAASLKRALGGNLVAFHLSGRWLVVDPVPEYESQGWSFDLRRPLLTSAPLFLPGLAFLVWVLVQLVRHAAWARLRGLAVGAAPGGGGGVRRARRAGTLPPLRRSARTCARGDRSSPGGRRRAADLRLLRAARARRDLRLFREPEPLRRLHADGRLHGVWPARPRRAPLPAARRRGAAAFTASISSAERGPPNSASWSRFMLSITRRARARLWSSLYCVW